MDNIWHSFSKYHKKSKKMKAVLHISIFILSILFLSSCEDVLNEKTSPEIALALEGEWAVDESSSIFDNSTSLNKATMQTYSVSIYVSDTDSTLINIDGFYGLTNSTASAKVSNYTLTFPENQTLSGGYTITSGSGTISKNLEEIELSYQIDDGSGEVDEVSATYTYKY